MLVYQCKCTQQVSSLKGRKINYVVHVGIWLLRRNVFGIIRCPSLTTVSNEHK